MFRHLKSRSSHTVAIIFLQLIRPHPQDLFHEIRVVLPVVLLVGVSVLLSAAGCLPFFSGRGARFLQSTAQQQADIDPALEVLHASWSPTREGADGGIPEVESSWVIRETEQGDLTLRLMDLTPWTLLASSAESGRLDLRVPPQEWWDRVAELAPFSAVLNSADRRLQGAILMQSRCPPKISC